MERSSWISKNGLVSEQQICDHFRDFFNGSWYVNYNPKPGTNCICKKHPNSSLTFDMGFCTFSLVASGLTHNNKLLAIFVMLLQNFAQLHAFKTACHQLTIWMYLHSTVRKLITYLLTVDCIPKAFKFPNYKSKCVFQMSFMNVHVFTKNSLVLYLKNNNQSLHNFTRPFMGPMWISWSANFTVETKKHFVDDSISLSHDPLHHAATEWWSPQVHEGVLCTFMFYQHQH